MLGALLSTTPSGLEGVQVPILLEIHHRRSFVQVLNATWLETAQDKKKSGIAASWGISYSR